MKNIKGLPRDLAYWIIDNRPFESVEDFILRLPNQYHKIASADTFSPAWVV